MKKTLLLFGLLIILASVFAQEPDEYYTSAENKTSSALKTALYNVITNHTELSYTPGIWTAFQTTDVRSDGKIWDMYSNTTNYTPITNQCGNYSGEGSCYNREHSMPKSWFSDAAPMVTDLFHIVATDGYVNGKRSNYAFGEVTSVTYSSNNGFSKLGTCTENGSTITVFEPNDEYKGDFARGYFYMVTAYENKVASWQTINSDNQPTNLNGTSYPAFNSWSITLLLKWSEEDPVSSKEINRNNIIYNNFQHNRNPFIDHPELAEYIWGNKMGQDWTLSSTGTKNTLVISKHTIISQTKNIIAKDLNNEDICIYDVSGRQIYSGKNISGDCTINNLNSGIYIIRINDDIQKAIVK